MIITLLLIVVVGLFLMSVHMIIGLVFLAIAALIAYISLVHIPKVHKAEVKPHTYVKDEFTK